MTLAHARALVVGLSVQEQPYTPEDDRAALQRLARWMLRFAPVVSPDTDGLLLDLSGCERLFDGEHCHVQKITAALTRLRLPHRLAVAPSYACARAVARYGLKPIVHISTDGVIAALAPLTVESLGVDAGVLDGLADVGIERIEHLLAIPRDELAARFGRGLLTRLDLALGNTAETLEPIRQQPRFEAVRTFDGPVKRVEIIEAAVVELLTALLGDLHVHDRGILSLIVEFHRIDVGPVDFTVTLTHPNRDCDHLWALLRPRLERVHLGFGVEEIYLRAVRTAPLPHRQTAFLRDESRDLADQTVALGELLDRLIDRLGVESVTRVRPAESYVPEQAFTQTALRRVETRASADADRSGIYPAHRPSQLFESPEPIRVISLVPDGPPMWLAWRGQSGNVVANSGPERIEFPWWTARGPAQRDYFEAEDEHGRRLWIYREDRVGQWYVHGQWV